MSSSIWPDDALKDTFVDGSTVAGNTGIGGGGASGIQIVEVLRRDDGGRTELSRGIAGTCMAE